MSKYLHDTFVPVIRTRNHKPFKDVPYEKELAFNGIAVCMFIR